MLKLLCMFKKEANDLKKLFLILSIVLFFSLVSCSDDPVEQGNPVTMVELSHLNIVLYEGQSYTVTSTVLPLDADDRELTWHSSELAVCTVEDGEITAHREGISVVTAKIQTAFPLPLLLTIPSLTILLPLPNK